MGLSSMSSFDEPQTDKHACKGQNSCKGKGGCKTGDNGCKGKNSCKGKGGCATDGSKPEGCVSALEQQLRGDRRGSGPPDFSAERHAHAGQPVQRLHRIRDRNWLRIPHYQHILEKKPVVDWFEIISENYMVDGGRPLAMLDQILEQYRVVQHGVSMYFGSASR